MNLKTANGKVIPEFKWNTNYFLDCTTVLYGASRSGKSTIIKHIMKILQPYIDQVLVVSPSEVSNRAYEGLVDSTLIHDRLYLADPNAKKKSDNNFAFIRAIDHSDIIQLVIFSNTLDKYNSILKEGKILIIEILSQYSPKIKHQIINCFEPKYEITDLLVTIVIKNKEDIDYLIKYLKNETFGNIYNIMFKVHDNIYKSDYMIDERQLSYLKLEYKIN